MLTSVIYRNDSATTTLLDLPTSIQNGQCLGWDKSIRDVTQTLSAYPAEQPYPSTEPKGLKRARLLEKIPPIEQQYHRNIQALVSDSLREIRSAVGERQWLLPRQHPTSELLQTSPDSKANGTCSEPPVVLSPIPNDFPSVEDIADRIVSNPFSVCTSLVIDRHKYQIPPRSTFLLSDVRRSSSLLAPAMNNVLPRFFDFILIDPPWQNRSVRHARTYKTTDDQREHPFLRVLPIVRSRLCANGLVGVWVTNKTSIRQVVLCALQEAGFQLHEEWIWIKVTTTGEPVTPLHGLWRRPYEVFLLFRRRQSQQYKTADNLEPENVFYSPTAAQHRIFAAVPDYHSRKPCLKEFIKPLLVDPTNYQALEMFARNLTAGWFCWGDEVLKFGGEGYWAKPGG
jgi:N6-adenosine-specific RNA methylase IME4